jgi:DAACS family dicarboxylate/amino acid:cation (Na+ or H+) symporter
VHPSARRSARKADSVNLQTRILLGLVAGAAAGISARVLTGGASWVTWVGDNLAGPAGQIFLRLLLMTVVPLVFTSIVTGVYALGDLRHVGRVGGRAMLFFLISTLCAGALGLALTDLFRPGDGISVEMRDTLLDTYRSQADGLQAGGPAGFGVHTFVQIVPRNPIKAAADMDMLAILFTALAFGAALASLPAEVARPVMAVIDGAQRTLMVIIGAAMQVAPFGVFGLVFVVTSRFGWDLLRPLGSYMLVVVVGLALHGALTISLLVNFLGGVKPLTFWKKSRRSLATAFSTSSSSATLPTNIAVAQEEFGLPAHIAGFVLPLGATMNMNGTALFEGVTVLFLAQVFGVELALGQQVVVLMLAVLTAIGAAGVPGGSLPLMMMVLATVGVPPEGIAIVIGVDRLLDMCRTTINVTGDLAAALFAGRGESSHGAG